MFDIGFFELLVVGVVGLLVIGPERLPETVRTIALWWGRLKRGIQNTRTEIEQQIGADDIRRQLHNEEVMRRLEESQESIKRTMSENVAEINQAIEESKSALEPLNEPLSESLKPSDHSSEDNQTRGAPADQNR
ncbi:MAG: hypothetical protein AseanaTS_09720 [Candidatus Pelagadaptatus aseana]|uniref:Sec-independent protein translocase protein TatB n=1 Tax=Candidatus Pelagadaptatus aseana TaxID=3120508 RepID=UPI0039B1362D